MSNQKCSGTENATAAAAATTTTVMSSTSSRISAATTLSTLSTATPITLPTAVAAKSTPTHFVLILMGVSGCGKTSIGKLLAPKTNSNFIDADDFHSEENKEKMARGIALEDVDRLPWLLSLHRIVCTSQSNLVVGCSALKRDYRSLLVYGAASDVAHRLGEQQQRQQQQQQQQSQHQHQQRQQQQHPPSQLTTSPVNAHMIKPMESKDCEMAASDSSVKVSQDHPRIWPTFIHLRGTKELIEGRLEKRSGHFMNPRLLDSQFEALEEITDDEKQVIRKSCFLTVDVEEEEEEIVGRILRDLELC